jgi:alpha-tubulin suppressor-like RCC1 family protein
MQATADDGWWIVNGGRSSSDAPRHGGRRLSVRLALRRAALLLVAPAVLAAAVAAPAPPAAAAPAAVAVPAAPAAPTALAELDPTERFVTSAYEDFLGRRPDPGGLAYWTGRLRSGGTPADLVVGLSVSPEWIAALVTGFYTDTLGRAPDAGGLAYWSAELQSGRRSVAETAAAFYSSDEYFVNPAFGNDDLETWVTDLYTKLLHRAADSGGRSFWAEEARRIGRTSVALRFYQSAESARTRVDNLYHQLLDRPAEPGGLTYWSGVVVARGDLALAAFLASSDEYVSNAEHHLTNVVKIRTAGTGSSAISCAIAFGDELWCWGANANGAVGNGGDGTWVSEPYHVGELHGVTDVVVGTTVCAVASGELWCWGFNGEAAVGNGARGGWVYSPYHVPGLHGVTAVAGGGYTTCAVANGGKLYCWGQNTSGTAGLGPSADDYITAPAQVTGLTGVSDVSTNVGSTCAVANSFRVYCWGRNANGEAATGGTSQVDSPHLTTAANVIDVETAAGTTCAVSRFGTLSCWGKASSGQVGNGTDIYASITGPIPVAGLAGVRSVSPGGTTCAVVARSLRCWGDNTNGTVGNGDHSPTVNVVTPSTVPGLDSVTDGRNEGSITCAINRGVPYCWGNNVNGAVGNGEASALVLVTSPSAVHGLVQGVEVRSSGTTTCAVANGRHAYCWGQNNYGQVGNGTKSATPVTTPARV